MTRLQALHLWLISERPASRRQAAWGRAYGTWRAFARNRLALVGLAIIAGLVLVALAAPWLAPYSPTQGDLANARLLPPSAAHWFGTDEIGRDLVLLPVSGFPLRSQWHLVHPRAKQLSPIAQVFREHLLRSAEHWAPA